MARSPWSLQTAKFGRLLGLLVLAVLAAVAGTADAQIQLVPGPPHLVSLAPKFITAGDFNGDGFLDVAVTNTTSNKITVLLGQEGGTSFGQVADVDVGRILRGLASGDLNGDGLEDLAVTDFVDSKVFVIIGGDGTLAYRVGVQPVDVAIGNFDGQKGIDLVIVDQGGKVVILLNRGGNNGFAVQGDFDVGGRSKRVAAADLDGDGLDDIIVINMGYDVDDISVLLNNGAGGFLTPPRNFIVGQEARDLAIADFNNDGVADIAVLNAGLPRQMSVSILINQTTVVDSKRIGTGFFTSQTPVILNCPATINGIPIFCHPNGIAAGDFDNDGFTDFAVTLSTQPQAGSVATSGLLAAFQGYGNGSFAFATQVTVGLNPQGIVTGDFNGDGITDLAIAEQGSLSVRIIHASAAECDRQGWSCHTGRCCASGSCVDGVCCGSVACPAGQFCDIPGSVGTCAPSASIPYACTDFSGRQCATGFCVDGFCCNFRTCPPGQFCNNPDGMCHLPADNGTPCNSVNDSGGDNQCASGHCTDGVCCQDDRCPAGHACDIPGNEGVCMGRLPFAAPCTVDAQCAPPSGSDTGFCTEGVCCEVRQCPIGQSCAISPAEGICRPAPTPKVTATPGVIPTPTRRSCEQAACPTGSICASDPGSQTRVCDCAGDCGGDNQVTVDELLVLVNAALGNQAVCPLGDSNGDGQIMVDDIMLAVGNLLHGCP